jgi:hypothetical protein
MKKNSLFAIIAVGAAIFGATQFANAQNNSPFWSMQGNNNATTGSKLGTLNAVPLKIYAGGTTVRMNINNSTGNVSIGNGATASPSYRLYVVGAAYGIYGTGTSYGIVGGGGSYGVYGSGTTAGLYGYGSGTYGTYSTGGTYGVYSSGGTYGVYGSGGTYGVYGNSSSGHGLHGVSSSSYGVYASSTNSYGGLATSTNSDGFDATTSNGYFGLYAYCGNSSGYGVYGYGGYSGLYGSGTTNGAYGYSSSGYGVHGESYTGIGGYFHSSGSWALEASTDSGYYAGVFFGHVYASQGFITSDRRLKKNIEDFTDAMSIINKLKPKHYQFKDDVQYTPLHLPSGMHYGLIAQDLEQVLPNLVHEEKFKIPVKATPLVIKPKSQDGKDANQYQQPTAATEQTENLDVKAVNYEELIPIMIKAMQEQNEKIEALTEQVNALTASRQPGAGNAAVATKLSNISLGQSIPNPANGTASIQYSNLPSGAQAQLLVSDVNGKMIKQMQLNNNSGLIKLDISSLSAGTYTYSLLVNGKLIESKSMQVAR